mgnify:CR=1 FL=1
MLNNHIPVVHHYYTDMLISLANFFDNVVFTPNIIKHFEFNIGNKSLQLDYKTQKEFPSIVITYEQSQMQQYHDWFLHRPAVSNQLLIPVLYNATKDLTLLIQEALYDHSITVNINCESSLQLLELQHRLEYYFPLNKYIEWFNYYTFINIPQFFLTPLLFDTNNDVLHNLFLKRDLLTDDLDHMVSVKYDPLVKLINLAPNGINSDNKSFSLVLNFQVMNYVPLYFQIPPDEIPRLNKKIKELQIDNICLPLDPTIPIIKLGYYDYHSKYKESFVPILNIVENEFETTFVEDNVEYVLIGKLIKRFEQYTGKIESDDYSYSVLVEIHETHNFLDVLINGGITGVIVNPIWDRDNGVISGIFNGQFDTNNFSRVLITDQNVNITLDLNTKVIYHEFDNLELYNSCNSIKQTEFTYHSIPYGVLTLFNNKYNDSRLNFESDKSVVTSCCVYTKEDDFLKIINVSSPILQNGVIDVQVENVYSDLSKTEYFNISGCINDKNLGYFIEQINEQEITHTQSVYILISGIFNNVPKFGASYIDHISLDIGAMTDPSSVYFTTSSEQFHNFNTTFNEVDEVLFSAVIPNIKPYLFFDCDYAYINLSLYHNFGIDDLNALHWTLFFKEVSYSDLNSDFKLIPYYNNSLFHCIALRIPIKFYTLTFGKYSKGCQSFYFKLFNRIGAKSSNADISE